MSNRTYHYNLEEPDGKTAEFNTFRIYNLGDKIEISLSRSDGTRRKISYEVVGKAEKDDTSDEAGGAEGA